MGIRWSIHKASDSETGLVDVSSGQYALPVSFEYDGQTYHIIREACTTIDATWSDDNGGECIVNITPQLCQDYGGAWFDQNGGGCSVDIGLIQSSLAILGGSP